MSKLENPLPTTLEGWKAEVEYRFRQIPGTSITFGPNLQGILNLMAEQLYANQTTYQNLMDQFIKHCETQIMEMETK